MPWQNCLTHRSASSNSFDYPAMFILSINGAKNSDWKSGEMSKFPHLENWNKWTYDFDGLHCVTSSVFIPSMFKHFKPHPHPLLLVSLRRFLPPKFPPTFPTLTHYTFFVLFYASSPQSIFLNPPSFIPPHSLVFLHTPHRWYKTLPGAGVLLDSHRPSPCARL